MAVPGKSISAPSASQAARAAKVAALSEEVKQMMAAINAGAAKLPTPAGWKAIADELDGKKAPVAPQKPAKSKKQPKLSNHSLAVLEKAYLDDLITKTPEGVWQDVETGQQLTSGQIKKAVQEFGEFYAVTGEEVSDGFALAPLGEPLSTVDTPKHTPPPQLEQPDASGQIAYKDPWAEPIAAMKFDPVGAESSRKAGRQWGEMQAKRKPGESIREQVKRLREMQGNPDYRPAVAKEIGAIESALAENLKLGRVGKLLPEDAGPSAALHNQSTRDYLDYLAANGVDQRTLDSIASGDLPMDPQSRMQRAEQMELDPKAIWHRWDYPAKTQFKGWTAAALSKPEYRRQAQGALSFVDLAPSKEGLVYTSHSPDYALRGVQIPRDQIVLYPLLGPRDGIAGIDALPPQAYDAFRDKQASMLKRKYPDSAPGNAQIRRAHQRKHHLAEPLAGETPGPDGARPAALFELRNGYAPGDRTSKAADGTIPHFGNAEDRKVYTEPLMASRANGTLVRDETGLSTAFTPAGAATLRRADLAPLDTRFKAARNILQSLLAPVAAYGAASQAGSGTSRK
jgi:hypothetical protein